RGARGSPEGARLPARGRHPGRAPGSRDRARGHPRGHALEGGARGAPGGVGGDGRAPLSCLRRERGTLPVLDPGSVAIGAEVREMERWIDEPCESARAERFLLLDGARTVPDRLCRSEETEWLASSEHGRWSWRSPRWRPPAEARARWRTAVRL